MPVAPPLPRFQLQIAEASTRIIIPNRKNWYGILIAIIWLVMFIFIEITFTKSSSINSFSDQPAIFLLFGGIGIFFLIWQIAGKETIIITNGLITIANGILVFSYPREYEAQHVKDLRVSQSFESNSPFPIEPGVIAFDYGARTYRFGRGCDEAEAKMILAEITQRYPQYLPVKTGNEKKV